MSFFFHNQSQSTNYVPYEKTVVEKRAPTDESIRLYEEIKEKAYNSILDSLSVIDNTFNFKVILYKDIYSFSNIVRYLFTLNSKEFDGEYRTNLENLSNKQELFEELYNKLATTIAEQLITTLIKETKYGNN